ncbi:hypothetical protein GCM10009682_20670 [Luedemannella flava]|uniref:LysR substrate-binding domain-containing protein n=1 Tax=Luedemannella flava TaxID=349316 RepID=A0ABP4Y509_9ACTN
MSDSTFRLLIVPGVTMDKWSRMWSERQPGVALTLVTAEAAEAGSVLTERADAGLVRLPVDPDTFHAIPLYTETTVVVVAREHVLTAADELTIADLADETVLRPLDDVLTWAPANTAGDRPQTTAAAVEWVASEAGVLVVPQSLARLHHRRDVTYRVLTDAPTSSVGLVWPRDGHTDLVEEMIGIVRGRTANSTRGRTEPTPKLPPAKARAGADRRTPPRRRGR